MLHKSDFVSSIIKFKKTIIYRSRNKLCSKKVILKLDLIMHFVLWGKQGNKSQTPRRLNIGRAQSQVSARRARIFTGKTLVLSQLTSHNGKVTIPLWACGRTKKKIEKLNGDASKRPYDVLFEGSWREVTKKLFSDWFIADGGKTPCTYTVQ